MLYVAISGQLHVSYTGRDHYQTCYQKILF